MCCASRVVPKAAGSNACCGKTTYNTASHFCCGGKVVKYASSVTRWSRCCGTKAYDFTGQICCAHKLFARGRSCCGASSYDYHSGTCCDGIVHNYSYMKGYSCCGKFSFKYKPMYCCGGTTLYNSNAKNCCGKRPYNDSKYICCGYNLFRKVDGSTKCCWTTQTSYQANTQLCCSGGGIFNVKNAAVMGCCKGSPYPRHSHICCNWHGNVRIQKRRESYQNVCCFPGELRNFYSSAGKCCHGVLYKPDGDSDCCGNKTINRKKNYCCSGKIYSGSGRTMSCCKGKPYDWRYEICCSDGIADMVGAGRQYCCGRKAYNNNVKQGCCRGVLYTRKHQGCCNGVVYDLSSHRCCFNTLCKVEGKVGRC